jgi:hypothetical protein
MPTAASSRAKKRTQGASTARTRAARRRQDSDHRLTLKIDGTPHTLYTADLGPLDTIAVRQATGMSLAKVLSLAEKDPDIDVMAVVYWLARRHAGEPGLSFEDVAEELSYDTSYEAVADDEDDTDGDEVDSPEA